MRLLFSFCFFALSWMAAPAAEAQEDRRATESIYVEAFGNTGTYSLNFDVAFPAGIGFRLGALRATETEYDRVTGTYYRGRTNSAFLMMLNGFVGRNGHHAEVGAGVIAGGWEHPFVPSLDSPALTATLGYRYQRPVRGVVVRVGFTPTWSGERIEPMVGASIGYSLRLKEVIR